MTDNKHIPKSRRNLASTVSLQDLLVEGILLYDEIEGKPLDLDRARTEARECLTKPYQQPKQPYS